MFAGFVPMCTGGSWSGGPERPESNVNSARVATLVLQVWHSSPKFPDQQEMNEKGFFSPGRDRTRLRSPRASTARRRTAAPRSSSPRARSIRGLVDVDLGRAGVDEGHRMLPLRAARVVALRLQPTTRSQHHQPQHHSQKDSAPSNPSRRQDRHQSLLSQGSREAVPESVIKKLYECSRIVLPARRIVNRGRSAHAWEPPRAPPANPPETTARTPLTRAPGSPTLTRPNRWGRSSVGRALEWHSRGRRFDPDRLHQDPPNTISHTSRPEAISLRRGAGRLRGDPKKISFASRSSKL